MKKAFIQKLSIAMASALVITAAAPATADAAAAMTMNKASKVLYLNEDNMTNTADTYDFSIKNKGKNYKTKYSFTWYAEDSSIVDVAKGGVVTAKKVGTTTVKCDVTKKSTGKLYTTVEATVTVKANAETVTIKNAPENNEMTVGTTFDFNRTMKAANGGKATDKTEWIVSADKEGNETTDVASIDKNGVVTTLKAGTFYVTAKTYQSAATKEVGYTAVSDPVEVKVTNTVTDFKAVKSNQLSVTFADTVDYAASSYVLTNVSTGARTYVKAVSSVDKKTVTLDLYNALTSGVTYKLTVDGMEATVDFVKGSVANIVINDQTIPAEQATALVYTVYDENGLDITADTTVNIHSSISLDSSKKLTLGDGAIAYVSISYFDVNTKQTITSRTATIKGSKSATSGILQATIADTTKVGNASKFDSIETTVTKGATGKTLFVQVSDQYGNKKEANYASGFSATFESLTPEILVVDKTTGAINAIAEGTAVVKITSNNITSTIAITVKAASNETSLSISYTNGSMTGVATRKNIPSVTVDVLDQYGSEMNKKSLDITLKVVSGDDILSYNNTNLKANNSIIIKDDSKTDFTPLKDGTVTFEVTRGTLATQYVTITVTDKNEAVDHYKIEGLTTLNVANAWGESSDNAAEATLTLYTVNTNNEYISNATAADVNIVVKKADNTTVASGSSVTFTKEDVKKLATGTYTVAAYKNNVAVATGELKVVDTTTAPAVTLSSNTITSGLLDITTLKGCLSIPDGYTLTGFKFVSTDSTVVDTQTSAFVQSATLKKSEDVTITGLTVQITKTSNGRTYESSNLGNILIDR